MQTEKPTEAKTTLRDTTAPKSDQINYDDFPRGVTRRIRVTGLKAGTAEQPVIMEIVDDITGEPMRPYKPCKSMRRVLIACWGDKGKDWIGKRAVLYGDQDVHFGGVAVGGIRISHVTGIEAPVRCLLATSRSKRSDYTVGVLTVVSDEKGGAA
jgi:hypothetical protein